MHADDESTTLPSAITRLAATGPHAAEQTDLMLYGRLIGAWHVDWVAIDAAGRPSERRRGEWHFAWILGGRAIQDVIWTLGESPASDGTTLRCWDRRHGTWRVVFVSPADEEFVSLIGRGEGDRIVQDVIERHDDRAQEQLRERWNFSEITDTGFLWQAETSSDGGHTWHVTHEMRARRNGAR